MKYFFTLQTLIFSAGANGKVNIWDIRAKLVRSMVFEFIIQITQKDATVNAVTMDPTGSLLAAINIKVINHTFFIKYIVTCKNHL